MENDDRPVGQILSRRDALKILGVGSAAFLAACAAPEATSTSVPTVASTAGDIRLRFSAGLCRTP